MRGWLAWLVGWFARGLVCVVLGWYLACCLCLLLLRWVDPPVTAVQAQRSLEALLRREPYARRYVFVPLRRIAPALQHAVVAAEDSRFFEHHGFDWIEIQKVLDENDADGLPSRGASTITQQLVKNLFLTTHRHPLRKAAEASLTPVVERLLGKQRILELYLNVVEWGPGVFGAEAAARYHYGIPAYRLSREQAARLAAILPSPRRWKPARMHRYSGVILRRMEQMGW